MFEFPSPLRERVFASVKGAGSGAAAAAAHRSAARGADFLSWRRARSWQRAPRGAAAAERSGEKERGSRRGQQQLDRLAVAQDARGHEEDCGEGREREQRDA